MTIGTPKPPDATPAPKILALSGGIGGAKLALGLYRVLPPDSLTILANTGDDFEHLGLSISPDLDTLLYTLAGLDNPELGWGRRGETWSFMAALEALGGESWFRLGDADLATHIERSRRLVAGESLSHIIEDFRRRLGIRARLLPMSDDPVRTRLSTPEGWLDFQDYFVRRRCTPDVTAITFDRSETAHPQPALSEILADPALDAIVICPSNPLISIAPILAVPGIRDALIRAAAPVIVVSPLIGGDAVKGPTAKMMRELGHAVTNAGIARHYGPLLDLLIADPADAAELAALDIPHLLAPTLMRDLADKEGLARTVLGAAAALRSKPESLRIRA